MKACRTHAFCPRMTMTFSTKQMPRVRPKYCKFFILLPIVSLVCALHADKSATPHSRLSLYPLANIIQHISTSISTPVSTHRLCIILHNLYSPKKALLGATTGNAIRASLDTGATTGAAEWGSVGAAGRALERVGSTT